MNNSGYILAASTRGKDIYTTTDTKPEFGLIDGHAYSLISVKFLNNEHQLVRLRNPWGSTEWTGDWSDNSAKWTPKLRAALSVDEQEAMQNNDDGLFWMSFQDFTRLFTTLTVCKCRVKGLLFYIFDADFARGS